MNLPNKLTLLRIILVPIMTIIWLFPYQYFNINFISFNIGPINLPLLNIIVLAIFIIASLTDLLDGHIARKRNLITTFGKFADPIADKLLINISLIILGYKGMIPIVCVIIMIARDLIVDGCRMIASSKGIVVAAGALGKAKTTLQVSAIIVALLNNLPFEIWSLPINDILIWFASFVSIVSGYSYFSQLKEHIFETI